MSFALPSDELIGCSIPLTPAEKSRLAELEKTIETGLETFLATGACLAEIRSRRLYRQHYATFELYVRDKWNLARSSADQLIRSAKLPSR